MTVLILIAPSITGSEEAKWSVGDFSTAQVESGLPVHWQPLTFRKIKTHTLYTLVKEDQAVVIKAVSRASASGLIRKIHIDPTKYPILTWRWKVTNILKKGDAARKEGDDFPARIYITFEYDAEKLSLLERAKYETARLIYGEYPPLCAISYVWGNKTPAGTIVSSAYSDKAVLIVVESGSQRLHQWVEMTRNIAKDYRAAFHEDPPMISGVAIMTDSDDTGESAVTYYGDILFSGRGGE